VPALGSPVCNVQCSWDALGKKTSKAMDADLSPDRHATHRFPGLAPLEHACLCGNVIDTLCVRGAAGPWGHFSFPYRITVYR